MIAKFCEGNIAALERGEAAFTDGYVEKFHFHPNISPPLMKAQVKASMRKKSYEVEVNMNYLILLVIISGNSEVKYLFLKPAFINIG